MAAHPCATSRSRDKRLVRRRFVRFWGSPDMADYPPRLVYDANDPLQKSGGPKCCDAQHGFSTMC